MQHKILKEKTNRMTEVCKWKKSKSKWHSEIDKKKFNGIIIIFIDVYLCGIFSEMNSERETSPRAHFIFCVHINSYFDIFFVCLRCVFFKSKTVYSTKNVEL